MVDPDAVLRADAGALRELALRELALRELALRELALGELALHGRPLDEMIDIGPGRGHRQPAHRVRVLGCFAPVPAG